VLQNRGFLDYKCSAQQYCSTENNNSIKFSLILYYYCAASTAKRPITGAAQGNTK
jgi:hypothetical protein